MRPLPILHAVLSTVLAAGLVGQVFLAGLGVFDSPAQFATHRDVGYGLSGIALLVIVTAALSRAGRAPIGAAGLVFLLFIVQSILVTMRTSQPAIAALHPVNGFLILLLSLWIARMAWAKAREGTPAASGSLA